MLAKVTPLVPIIPDYAGRHNRGLLCGVSLSNSCAVSATLLCNSQTQRHLLGLPPSHVDATFSILLRRQCVSLHA